VKLTRRHAYLFLSIAIWNVVTYGVFTKNLAATDGRPTGYYVAHTVLIIVNLAIAGVLAFLAVGALRSPRAV